MNLFKKFALYASIAAVLAAPVFAQAPTAALNQAQKLLSDGKKAEALTLVDNYLVSKPNDAQFRFFKGVILTELGKTAEAIKLYTDLIRDFPELPEPYNNLAVLYSATGQTEQAKNALETAIRNHPGYATAHENLGDVYLQLARQSYAKSIELGNAGANVKGKLAKTQAALTPAAK